MWYIVDNWLISFLKTIIFSFNTKKEFFSLRPFLCWKPLGFHGFILEKEMFFFLCLPHSVDMLCPCSLQTVWLTVFQLCCHRSWGQGQSDRMCSYPTRLSRRRASGLNRIVQTFTLPTLDWMELIFSHWSSWETAVFWCAAF